MRLITPIAMTKQLLDYSSVAESTYAYWDVSEVYVTGNTVSRELTHREYECVVGNTGQDPATDDGTYWLDIGATNLWKPFDGHISDPLTDTTSPVTFRFAMDQVADSVAFFGLAAASVNVRVRDPSFYTDPSSIWFGLDNYDVTIDLVDTSEVLDWYTWLTAPVTYATEALFTGVPIYSGVTLYVDVAGSGTIEIGQLVFGRDFYLGESTTGTSIGTTDYSTKGRDDFGNAIIVEREFAQRANYEFAFNAQTARYVQRTLDAQRAVPSVFYVDTDTEQFGTMVYGFYTSGFEINLMAPEIAFASLQVEGLV